MTHGYLTQRGVLRYTRPYAAIGRDERKEILVAIQSRPWRDVIREHNISRITLNHIRLNCKHLLIGVETLEDKVRAAKRAGLTSGEAAAELKVDLREINHLWPQV